jgi:hypothetical protein
MTVIQNKWIEKEHKKKVHETAPAYASDHLADSTYTNVKKPLKHYTYAARSSLLKTLRGLRK